MNSRIHAGVLFLALCLATSGCRSTPDELRGHFRERPVKGWLAAVTKRAGWQAPPEKRANGGRVQVRGIYLDDQVLLVALPRTPMTMARPGRVESVELRNGGHGLLQWLARVQDFEVWGLDRPFALGTFNFVIGLASGTEGWG